MATKVKILHEGQPCRRCYTPVIKKYPRKKVKTKSLYFFSSYYLFCPSCHTIYFLESNKKFEGHSEENILRGKTDSLKIKNPKQKVFCF